MGYRPAIHRLSPLATSPSLLDGLLKPPSQRPGGPRDGRRPRGGGRRELFLKGHSLRAGGPRFSTKMAGNRGFLHYFIALL